MNRPKARAIVIGLAFAGIPLVTTATCDPRTGTFNLFRDDDDYYYDDGFFYDEIVYFDDYYFDDCSFFDCF